MRACNQLYLEFRAHATLRACIRINSKLNYDALAARTPPNHATTGKLQRACEIISTLLGINLKVHCFRKSWYREHFLKKYGYAAPIEHNPGVVVKLWEHGTRGAADYSCCTVMLCLNGGRMSGEGKTREDLSRT